jgi:hypothetical protein
MFTDKYISVFSIIANLVRDGNYEQSDLIENDLIEWAADCLDLVGVPGQYIDKITCLTGERGRFKLPIDYHQRVQVSGLFNNSMQFPMRENTGSFHGMIKSCGCIENCGCTNTTSAVNYEMPISEDENGNPVFNFSNSFNVGFNKNIFIGNVGNVMPNDPTYKINDNFIITNLDNSDCKLLLNYKAFPIDDCGYPMIPDNISYKLAVQWYIAEKLDRKLWRSGRLAKDVWLESEKNSLWYIGKANSAGLQPSLDKLESWKNQTLQLLPSINRHSEFFQRMGQQQTLRLGQRPNVNRNYYL